MTTTSPSTHTRSATHTRPVIGAIALWTIQVLLALIFVFMALPKAFGNPIAVAPFEVIGLGIPGMVVVGWLELAGAIALLIPRLSGLASICQIPLMIGATILSTMVTPDLVAIPVITLVLVCIVAWFRRFDTTALIHTIRRWQA
ncbi:DoxX family protein [Brevibacterium sp. FME17]|uniref:DoxX family protein n=1 Tax=Brevibacterium sp. FME17 TaxID=2742606 RepID=UPI001868C84D|nr:DoxX family protein [Brevibacterium sp. FME17]